MNRITLIIIISLIFFSCKRLEIKRINKVETLWSNFENNQIIAKGNIIDVAEGGISDYGFCYAANNDFPTINDNRISLGATNKAGEFSANLTSLQAFKVYHYRAYVISNNQVTYGNVFGVDVVPTPFYISVDSFNILSSKQVDIKASITGIGGLRFIDFGIAYSLVSNPNTVVNKQSLGKLDKDSNFTFTILNPLIDTNYYVKTYAQANGNTHFSSVEKILRVSSVKFTTDTAVVTRLVSAKINGSFQNLGADKIQEYGFCYATNTSFPTLNNSKFSYQNPTLGSFSSNIIFTTYGTYYYRTYVIIDNKIIYGQVKSFEFN